MNQRRVYVRSLECRRMDAVEPEFLRILDVNLNRSREALRAIEDFARFALDDADAATAAKRARHDLRLLDAALPADDRLDARDIVCDIGRDAKTAGELQRATADDVVRAEFGRLTEALRALGEFGKHASVDRARTGAEACPNFAQTAERLRYAAYELEQRIVLRGTLRGNFRACRLYVIVTEALCRRGWLETADAAISGGAACIQLREKALPDSELLRRARALRDLTRRRGALLIINDRPDIARLCGADGVHVGQDDLSVHDARHVGGARLLVGKSTHTLEQTEAALAEEPDYVAIGPMFPSPTKPQTHIAGLQSLSAVAGRTELPLVAIGGITPYNAREVFAAGATCACVCSAVISAEDPERAARGILDCATAGSSRRHERAHGHAD